MITEKRKEIYQPEKKNRKEMSFLYYFGVSVVSKLYGNKSGLPKIQEIIECI